jgi:hypothetical protein
VHDAFYDAIREKWSALHPEMSREFRVFDPPSSLAADHRQTNNSGAIPHEALAEEPEKLDAQGDRYDPTFAP